jgi:acetyl-CoA synthetase
MSDRLPIPDRVRVGSPSPIRSFDDFLRHTTRATYDPDGYWLEQAAQRLSWRSLPTVGLEGDFYTVAERPIRWFADGQLNVTESCLDRHLATRGDKVAILWEGDEPGTNRRLTYRELHREVCRTANALAAMGVQRGDRVIIYMGMIPEAVVAMLAVARLGAVHSVVFGGFSAESLRDRIQDCGARVVITQDEGRRGGKPVPLKHVVDKALVEAPVDHVLVYRHTGSPVGMTAGRDHWWHEVVPGAGDVRPAEIVDAEHPLFVLYTSGSTGKPKGLLHTCGGYLLWATWTCQVTFDLRDDDVFACMADVGWVTGHSYIVYGPLSNGATSAMFESIPTYPDAGRYWDFVHRHKITVFYTAPTALRALAAYGEEPVRRYDRSSLRVLGTVGEPINPDTWRWYHDVVGEGRCAVVDTWWQTETGGHLITPVAPVTEPKPGSATLPLPGVMPVLFDDKDRVVVGPGSGRLCLQHAWPGMARTVWGDHARFVQTYFSMFKGYYFTGDGARRDKHGYWWITGRVDDVINVSGHRMGTAEFESALVEAPEVAEAAVVGYPHDLKGQGVWAYVILQPGATPGPQLEAHLNGVVRRVIGAHARVDVFQFVPGLPKTRSGKVMRRILRKIAEGEPNALGDLSTLADPGVVANIVTGAEAVQR